MRGELVVSQLLSVAAGVTALVPAVRITPSRVPQASDMPSIVVEMVSGTDIPPITAAAGGLLVKSRIQVTVLAKTYTEVKRIHEAIRAAVLFQSGAFSFVAPNPVVAVRVIGITRDLIGPDFRDDQLGLYLQSVDYQVIHDEA